MKKERLHQHLQTLPQETVLYLEFIEKLAIWSPFIADLHLAAHHPSQAQCTQLEGYHLQL